MLKRVTSLVLLMALASCGDGRTLTAPIKITSRAPHDIEKNVWANITMTVRGDETLDLEDRRLPIHMVEIFGPTVPRATYFFSVSVAEAFEVDSGRLLFDADVAPGIYDGSPGTYEISDKGAPPIPGKPQAVGGAAYIWFLHPEPQPLVRFDVLLEPCTMKIEKDGLDGTVDCPKLGTLHDKKTVSLHWTWELV